ncbi:homoserine kinase [Novacetimonas cocois]|uniref:Homoserine kinase n=1 Tax=Novacetimonas cocois TaxID=1747507 RepID=A0A365Z113_9PROT|nr:homoserine kinase [Novacetimonas cocois]RBM09671.1 homoserine kinase [Novacetimonas cocois]
MAVYTDVPPDELSRFLGGYDIGEPVSCHGIAEGVENSNFLLRTTRADYILTLYERRVVPGELPWFLGLMLYLAQRGLSCPRPVADRAGSTLGHLAGRPAAITTFLQGTWPRQITPSHCEAVGAAMARLHQDGQGYTAERRNGLGPAAWPPLLESCRAQGDQVQPGLVAEIDAALATVLPSWPGQGGHPALPRGQIHADLFPDNVFFIDDRLSGLIDFYFACTDWLAYDLAIALNAWCFDESAAFCPARAQAMVRGYESVRILTEDERRALPVLATGASVRFTLTRLYDWINTPPDALVTPKDPLDYLARLRFFRAHPAMEWL